MIVETIVVIGLFILTFLLVVKYRIGIINGVVEMFAVLPMSHDTRLETLLDIAGRYYVEKNYLAAEKAYLKVLKVDHKNSLAYSRLGFIYSHFGQVEDAIECFQIVADTYPNAASYYNLAMMLFKNHRFKRSAAALEKSIEMEETTNRLIALARVYRVTNDFDRQLKVLQKALEREPENVSIMQLLAEAYLHEHHEKEAKAVFQKIIKIEPNNSRARQALEPKPPLKKFR
jgi:tetratricopeptide (TPR) repeat protein